MATQEAGKVDTTPAGVAKLVDLRSMHVSDDAPAVAAKAETALKHEKADRVQQDSGPTKDQGTEHARSAKDEWGHPRALLSSGHSIPLVGLGTWKSEKGQVKDAVIAAIKAGYHHIDCAAVYGNEEEVGEGLQTVLQEGHITRDHLFVTSKLWNTEHAPERVEPAVRKTLTDLKLDYLDLYLIHWPSSLKPGPTVEPPLIDTWRAMETLVEKGLVRSIGVSNFSSVKLKDILQHATIPPAVLQVEAHPYWNNNSLVDWCGAHGIHVTAYSPLGSPDSASMTGRSEDMPSPLKDPWVKKVADDLGKTPGQVLIRWAVQRGTSVVPKSVNPERIASNLDVFSWSIPADQQAYLSKLNTQIRMVPGTFLLNPSGPYKTLSDLWDDDSDEKNVEKVRDEKKD